MTRPPSTGLADIPGAQTQDCVAAGLLSVDAIAHGASRVPRDPLSGRSDLITVSAGIRNISSRSVSFTASFPAPGVRHSFVTGQSWTLSPGELVYVDLANVPRPGLPEAEVRRTLRLILD